MGRLRGPSPLEPTPAASRPPSAGRAAFALQDADTDVPTVGRLPAMHDFKGIWNRASHFFCGREEALGEMRSAGLNVS